MWKMPELGILGVTGEVMKITKIIKFKNNKVNHLWFKVIMTTISSILQVVKYLLYKLSLIDSYKFINNYTLSVSNSKQYITSWKYFRQYTFFCLLGSIEWYFVIKLCFKFTIIDKFEYPYLVFLDGIVVYSIKLLLMTVPKRHSMTRLMKWLIWGG